MAPVPKPFKNLDLSSLPKSNPGSGKPWLNNGALWIGDSSAGLVIDEFGSIVIAPTKDNITRHILRVDWTEPADGQFIDIVNTTPIAAGAIDATNQPIPPFRLELNLTKFGATYDHPFAIGYYGNGTTTDTCYWVQEVGYDTAAASTLQGAYRSNERYDVVQHVTWDGSPNPHWPTSIRCGFAYSTYAYGSASSPTMVGIVVLDAVSFSSAYPNPLGTGGAFGLYCSMSGNNVNGHGNLSVHAKDDVGSVTLTAKPTGSSNSLVSINPLAISIDQNTSGSALSISSDNVRLIVLYKSAQEHTLRDANFPTLFVFQSADNHASAAVRTVVRNTTTGVSLTSGVTSATFSWDGFEIQNKAHITSNGGGGLAIGTNDTKAITFTQGTEETARFDTGRNFVLQNGHKLGVRTLATLPLASASTGLRFQVSNSSPAYQEVYSDGTDFRYAHSNATV